MADKAENTVQPMQLSPDETLFLFNMLQNMQIQGRIADTRKVFETVETLSSKLLEVDNTLGTRYEELQQQQQMLMQQQARR